jgi:transposase
MQPDAHAGFGKLYQANRKAGPIIEAACWAPRQAQVLL